MTISILGCGWLGFPLAKQLVQKGYRIKGSTTRTEKIEQLRQHNIEPFLIQLTPKPTGEGWEEFLKADILVINIPPRLEKVGANFHLDQMRALKKWLDQMPIERVMYVSSTSVYPELSRVVVEEEVQTPEQSATPALVMAEQIVQTLADSWLVLRCGGLMGYERIPAKYVSGKKNLTTGDIPVNYIHRDDAIAVIDAFLDKKHLWNDTYNVVAPLHPSRREVYIASAQPFGFEIPTFQEADAQLFKIISSQKLQQSLHFTFKFPDPLGFLYGLSSDLNP
ncbi:MAG: SDR family NAD(P)-dependent oxidoreductase [Runella sp.]